MSNKQMTDVGYSFAEVAQRLGFISGLSSLEYARHYS